MKKWIKKFEDIMAAASYAEAGEFETARQTLKEQRSILLALTGERSDKNAFRYALNMCKRITADLDILYVSDSVKGLLKEFKTELKKHGVAYQMIQKSGNLEEEVRNYSSMKKDILFVVVEVSEDVAIHSKKADKILSDAWDNLKCPLVVVSQPLAA